MEILVGEKETQEYVKEAKEKEEVIIKGKGRDTVKAVDTAELLKQEGFKVENVSIDTLEENDKRISVMEIKLKK